MTVGIVDTTVIIHYFRKQPAAHAWLNAQPERLSITPITWLEVMYGAPGKAGQAACKLILNQFDMEYLTASDMNWAMQQMESYRLSHGVGINDSLIASICHRLQVPLYTHNLKHMNILLNPSLVIKPY
ncbi:MAG: PIN domain-containing protein [Chitinophagaceae bacterium]|nr:PIN domain-containing protein [Anaerolineae bacterium]